MTISAPPTVAMNEAFSIIHNLAVAATTYADNPDMNENQKKLDQIIGVARYKFPNILPPLEYQPKTGG